MIGKLVAEFVAPEKREMIARRSESVYEGVALRKDGTTFEAEFLPRMIEYRGELHRFVAVRDISARKAVERLKDELVSVISHELRTPLTSIRGSLGLAAGGAFGALPAGARDMVDLALRNTERLSVLVDHILDMEKAAAGRLTLRRGRLDLLDAVRQAVDATGGLAEEFGVSFVIHEFAGPVPVLADGDRIVQVISNLLSNAVKFSPSGGEVGIAVTLSAERARVTVDDDGPGIPEAFCDRLFDKFTQADSTDSRHVPGSGLGLYISKAIVEEHGGAIGFEARPTGGTSFYFDLPLENR